MPPVRLLREVCEAPGQNQDMLRRDYVSWLAWKCLGFPRLAKGGGARGRSGHLCCPHNWDPDKQQKMDGWMNSRSFLKSKINQCFPSELLRHRWFFPIVTWIYWKKPHKNFEVGWRFMLSLVSQKFWKSLHFKYRDIQQTCNIFLCFIHKACSLNKERSLSNMSKLSFRTCKEHYFTAISCTLERYFGNEMYVRSRTCFNHPITQFTPFQVFSIFLNLFFHSWNFHMAASCT